MRINYIWRNIYHNRPMSFGMLLLSVSLIICALPPNMQAEEVISETLNAKTTPCQGLRPFNNLDDLLYQFYLNLESDCLFEMSVAELEKAWETKILSVERLDFKQEAYQLRNGEVFFNKPYMSPKDAFYIEIEPDWGFNKRFAIKITKEYAAKHSSLYPGQKLPELLPEPIITISPQLMGTAPRTIEELVVKKPSPFQYTWYNSDKTRQISFTDSYGVSLIIIRQSLPNS